MFVHAKGCCTMATVTVVILNTNRKIDTLRCIESLTNQNIGYHSCEILVIDNGCNDGSNLAITESYPSVRIISTEVDKGYAGNNNYGVFKGNVSSDYLFIVNEDAYLLPDVLRKLMDFLDENSDVGIIGPVVVNESDINKVQANGCVLTEDYSVAWRNFNNPVSSLNHEPEYVDWVHGCGFMIRTELFRQLGGFWQELYYTWEEVDLCVRTKAAGYSVVVHPSVHLAHRDSPSEPSVGNRYYMTRNKLFFLNRHATSAIYITELIRVVLVVSKSVLASGWVSTRPLAWGFIDALFGRYGKCRWR